MLTKIKTTNNGSLTSQQVMCCGVKYVIITFITSYHVQIMAITLIILCVHVTVTIS